MNYRFENLEIAHSSHRVGELKEKELYRNGFELWIDSRELLSFCAGKKKVWVFEGKSFGNIFHESYNRVFQPSVRHWKIIIEKRYIVFTSVID